MTKLKIMTCFNYNLHQCKQT